ncbi:MAG: rod-binding protein, partial [Caldimonas sp.]
MAALSSSPALSGLPSSASNTLSIAELRSAAARDPKAAIRETAKQFEALFMQQIMKSMREATVSSGMLDNEGTKLGNEMLDSQYAAKMTGLPGGLTDAIARQLERQMGTGAAAALTAPSAAAGAATPASTASTQPLTQKQTDFVQLHGSAARAAQAQSGIPAAFMIGQAAHETG